MQWIGKDRAVSAYPWRRSMAYRSLNRLLGRGLERTARDVDGQKGEGITGLEGEMFWEGRG